MSGQHGSASTLQNLYLPLTAKHPSEELLLAGDYSVEMGRCIVLAPGSSVSFFSYFNAFDYATWNRAAALESVGLELEIEGRARVKLLGRDHSGCETVLEERSCEPGEFGVESFELAYRADCPIITVEIDAQSQTRLSAGRFTTTSEAKQSVRLAIVITVFKREQSIYAALAKFAAASEAARGEIADPTFIVVDNGGTVDPHLLPAALRTVVLGNPNTGGAGGFSRGITEATRLGMSHAIFMDDDAACEFESVTRTIHLLEHARYPKLAISGAMLLEDEPCTMHERGAHYQPDAGLRILSNSNGLHLTQPSDLARSMMPVAIGYAGWWFFAFPLSADLRYPYPMFVRGDDWLFSYLNDFHIVSLNGVCSWQAHFGTKLSPMEQFLAFKGFLVADLILSDFPNHVGPMSFFRRWFRENLYGFCYDRAELQLEAVRAVLSGPSFWSANVRLGGLLQELRTRIRQERDFVDIDDGNVPECTPSAPHVRQTFLRAIATHVLGWSPHRHLPIALVDIRDGAQASAATYRRAVVYQDGSNGRVFVAARHRLRFIWLWLCGAVLFWRLERRFGVLSELYRGSVREFCTARWWDERNKQAP